MAQHRADMHLAGQSLSGPRSECLRTLLDCAQGSTPTFPGQRGFAGGTIRQKSGTHPERTQIVDDLVIIGWPMTPSNLDPCYKRVQEFAKRSPRAASRRTVFVIEVLRKLLPLRWRGWRRMIGLAINIGVNADSNRGWANRAGETFVRSNY